jgi:hypothetical protein
MKVIVAGSRDGFVAKNVFEAIEESPFVKGITEIVSGGARGVDKDGEYYARCNKLPLKVFLANWDEQGKAAGSIRNKQMAEYADALVAVWDGHSRGTANMIQQMERLGKPVYVYTR